MRRWRPRLGWLALGACTALILWTRIGDPFGDRGLANVATGALVVAAALGGLVAFARRRELALAVRLAGLAAVALALVASFALVRVQGVSAEMIPELRWRWRTPERAVLAVPSSGAGSALGPARSSDFPAFLGARRDNAVPAAALARDWSAHPPRRLWGGPIGAGWSAFAVAGGVAFTLEQDERGQRASARSAADGALLWSTVFDAPFAHVLGGDGPRSTPAVELGPEPGTGRVFALSAWGTLACFDAASGVLLWSHDLVGEHGSTRDEERERVQYGRSGSPLLVGELVIVPAGGAGAEQAGLVAFETDGGRERWRSPPRQVSHSSPVLATLAGQAQILIVNEDSLSGHAPADGRLLWEFPWPGSTSGDANVSQAVPVPPGNVFVSKGYGGGGLLLALDAGPGAGAGSDGPAGLVPRELWHAPRLLRTKLTNVVLHEGFVYGLDDGVLECVELASGAKRWKEGRYGHGQILLAGDLLLVASEEGEVSALAPDPERANARLGTFQGLAGKCWAHLALADGVLFLRNAEECAAWELARAR